MKTKKVRFIENPWLPPMPDGTAIVFRESAVSLLPMAEDILTLVAPPGAWTPERIGKAVNELRDQGYAVEVLTEPGR